MGWTTDEAMTVLKKLYPEKLVVIADGGHHYVVGTIEDENEVEVASFMLSFEPNNKNSTMVVTSIRVGRNNRYCGKAKPQNNSSPMYVLIPLQVTSIDKNGSMWGRVSDYEVCVNNLDLITATGEL